MSKKETLRRYALFTVSLFFMGLGVALTKHGELGVSPISSVANVVSAKFTFLTFGNWLIITNCVLILGQIIILKKKFRLFQLMQIPLSVLFGYFTDFGMFLSEKIPNEAYFSKLALVVVGTAVLGFGIALGVIANVILNSGEAFVKAIADTLDKDFGNAKICFDISWVLLSLLLSLVFFNGKIVGIREGTLISALLVGTAVKIFRPLLERPLEKILKE